MALRRFVKKKKIIGLDGLNLQWKVLFLPSVMAFLRVI